MSTVTRYSFGLHEQEIQGNAPSTLSLNLQYQNSATFSLIHALYMTNLRLFLEVDHFLTALQGDHGGLRPGLG